jgi:hypothetical protein
MERYLDNKGSNEIKLSKEDRNLIYFQLMARKKWFEEDMLQASNNKDIDRVLECSKVIEMIQTITNKMLV